jgi:hypothetical protein
LGALNDSCFTARRVMLLMSMVFGALKVSPRRRVTYIDQCSAFISSSSDQR